MTKKTIILTIIFSLIFVFLLLDIYLRIKPLQNTSPSISNSTPTNTTNQLNQDLTPTKILTEGSFQVKSIKDDIDSISKLVLVNQNNQEIIISQAKYLDVGESKSKPNYEFIFSPDKKFIYYTCSFYEGGFSGFYDIEGKKNNNIPYYGSTNGFDNTNSYFYSCEEAGMNGGGIFIYDLKNKNPVHQKEGSFSCRYNLTNNLLYITNLLETNSIDNIFSFSTGSFKKE